MKKTLIPTAKGGVLMGVVGATLCCLSTQAQPQGGPGRFGPMMMSPVIRTIDANRDGTLDANELAKAGEALKTLDRNQDGKVTGDELRPRGMAGGARGRDAAGGSGGRPGGFSGPRGPRGGAGGAVSREDFTSTPLPRDATEEKILAVLKDISENQRRGNMIVPFGDGRILRLLAEAMGARHVAEFGTSVGHSGIWLCLGMRKTGGKLTTFEIDEGRAAIARENFKRAGVADQVELIMGDAHETVSKLAGPVDMVFLDADKEGYVDYLAKVLPKLRPGGLVVAHNMNTRQADPRFLKAITTNPELETLFLNLETSGISVSIKKR